MLKTILTKIEELQQSIEEIQKLQNHQITSFFICFNQFSIENSIVINSTIIPNIGDKILIKNAYVKVIDKIISYKMVEDYELNCEGRGGEMIWLIVKKE
jgi:hypothetical protein